MMKYFLILLFLVVGCKDVSVRNAEVYSQELDFIDAATLEHVERSKALMSIVCSCVWDGDILMFSEQECESLAETIVVLEARMQYHTNYMRYLGGLTDKQPGDAPSIPEPIELCKEAAQ